MLPPVLEVLVPNQMGRVTWRVLPAMRGTLGVKLMVLVELVPVTRLLLLQEQPVMREGQNWTVDCPVPRVLLLASLMKTRMF
jgi:hypothetical protein